MRIVGLRKICLDARVRSILLRALAGLLAIVLILFVFYHITSTGEREIRTMLVTTDTVEKTVMGEGLLFRTECPITSSYAGLTVPLVNEGAHVPKDTELVSVYADGAEYQASYRTLSGLLDRLTEAKEEHDVISDLSAIASDAESELRRLIASLQAGNAESAREIVEGIRILEARMEALKSETFSLNDLITALKEQIAQMTAAAGSRVETPRSPVGGYFYGTADGYGTLCDPAVLKEITAGELIALADTVRADAEADPAGTLVTDSEWFVSLPIARDSLPAMQVGTVYTVIFPDNGGVRIPMTLSRIAEGNEDEPSCLILSTRRMPQGFSFDRLQSVAVGTDSTEGFSIPSKAIHTLGGYTGVYVLEGNPVSFCRIEILRSLGVRAIVKATDPTPSGEFTENTYRYVALYDALILSGDDLFHGRVLS